MKTMIITDSNCDLDERYLREANVEVIPFHFILSGKEYTDDFGKSISYEDFYDRLRKGEMATTAQIVPNTYEELFTRYVQKGFSIIYIGFSSALSESLNHSIMAKDAVLRSAPDADITIIDSKAASVGQGLLVAGAAERLKSGKSKQEVIAWVEDTKLRVNHWFTVDSLDHLKRGGRLSASSAAIGSILNVKPILIVDDDGRLVPEKKVVGRHHSIRELFNQLRDRGIDLSKQTIYISHGDCLDDANRLKDMIKQKLQVKDIIISNLGPVIGAHTGPGLLCIAFIAEKRRSEAPSRS